MKKQISVFLCIVMMTMLLPPAVMADYNSSYMPNISELITDITFDGVTGLEVGTELYQTASNSELGVNYSNYNYDGVNTLSFPMYYDDAYVTAKDAETDNKYIQSKEAANYAIRLFNTADLEADTKSLVISFKIKANLSTNNTALYSLGGANFFGNYYERDNGTTSGDGNQSGGLLAIKGTQIYGLNHSQVYTLSADEADDWITIDVKYTWTEDSDTSNTVRMDFIYVNGNDCSPAVAPTVTKTMDMTDVTVEHRGESGVKPHNFQKLSYIKFFRSGGTATSSVAFDDIRFYIPQNEVSDIYPSNESKVFADDSVYVNYLSEAGTADINGINFTKLGESGFEAVADANFEIDASDLSKVVFRGTLEKNSVYKLEAGDKTSVFSTYEDYMPAAETVKKAIFSNFTTGTAVDMPASNNLTASKLAKPNFDNNNVSISNSTAIKYLNIATGGNYKSFWGDAESMVISFEYYDEGVVESTSGDWISLTMNNPYIKDSVSGNYIPNPDELSDYSQYATCSVFSIDPARKRYTALGGSFVTIDGYEPGWHRVDMELNKEGIAWLSMDGEILEIELKHKDNKVYSSMEEWRIPTIGISQASYTAENYFAVDNIIAYVPADAVAPAIVTEPSAENNYTLTADKQLYVKGTVTMTGNGIEDVPISYDISNDGKSITPVIPGGINNGISYILRYSGFKDLYGMELPDYTVETGSLIIGNMSVKKNGEDFVPIIGTESSYTVDASTKIYNKSDTDAKVIYTVAQYKNSKLVSAKSDIKIIPANGSDTAAVSIELKNISEDTSVKEFLWTAESFNPLTTVKNYDFAGGDRPATLHLVADSIGVTYSDSQYPQTGIGNKISGIFNDNLTLVNYSVGGSTTQNYIDNPASAATSYSGRNSWELVKSNINPGDYVLIILGINDSGKNITPEQYMNNIQTFIDESRSLGAEVIVSTASYTGWGVSDALFNANKNNYADYARQIAAANGVTILDLYDIMKADLIKIAGGDNSKIWDAFDEYFLTPNLFAEVENSGVAPYKNSTSSEYGYDITHLSYKGAERVVNLLGELLTSNNSTLKGYLK